MQDKCMIRPTYRHPLYNPEKPEEFLTDRIVEDLGRKIYEDIAEQVRRTLLHDPGNEDPLAAYRSALKLVAKHTTTQAE